MWPTLLLLLALAGDLAPPPATFGDTLVVTASRVEEPLSDAPAPITVLSRQELATSPSLTLDEALRQVPGFSLFRRGSSLDAHPTTQGVSLRGIGPSGAGRSLVLYAGIPLNDPFGGWVMWNRLPVSALSAVEVAPGAGSPLWGSAALGGTIQLRPRAPESGRLEITARGGERGLAEAGVFASDLHGPWGWTVAGRSLQTRGFFLLGPQDRGAVDRPAGVRFDAVSGRLEHGRLHLGTQLYRERRRNGTELQTNSSRLALVEAGFRSDRWSWNAYGQTQHFESAFSRILPNRSSEILTAVQEVPASAWGGSLTFEPERVPGLLVGADLRRVVWRGGDDGGGDLRQDLAGAFAQQKWRPAEHLTLTAGVRLDRWQNRTDQIALSPRLGAAIRSGDAVTVRASVYRGFRAPTLNELYRPFRVGNVVTKADPDLSAERLTGVEAGMDFHPAARGKRFVWGRLNAFFERLDDPVGNLTVAVAPDRVLRRRANLGRVTVPGFEAEAGAGVGDRLRFHLAFLSSNPRVEATGLRLPQVPQHQATLRLDAQGPSLRTAPYGSPRHDSLRWAVEGRWASNAFEDDRETMPLGGLVVIDAAVTAPLAGGLELTLAADNLFDRRHVTGHVPETRLGAPRTVWLGLGWNR